MVILVVLASLARKEILVTLAPPVNPVQANQVPLVLLEKKVTLVSLANKVTVVNQVNLENPVPLVPKENPAIQAPLVLVVKEVILG
jgi:hypothetical protein